MMRNAFIVFLLLPMTFVHGFVLDSPYTCPALAPCACHGIVVDCTVQDLALVPAFRNVVWNYTKMSLYFQGNQIGKLYEGSFESLNISHRFDIELDLHLTTNKLSTRYISDQAFRGIEHAVVELYLEDNLLTTIPRAVATLTRLRKLQIPANPISVFETATMKSLGRSLTFFYFEAHHMSSWQPEIRYLASLDTLRIGSILMEELPEDAFVGLEHNLTQLHIYHSDIKLIPSAVCRLLNLRELTSSNSRLHAIAADAVLTRCDPKLSHLETLSLSHDLSSFPDIFSDFPNLKSLQLTYNPHLNYINESFIPSNASVQELKLTYANFDRIPNAIQKLSQLQTLDLSHNKITSIQFHDLENLSLLSHLVLSNNPISFISPDAFDSLHSLGQLNLQSTGFKCSCPLLRVKYLTENAHLTITGRCASSSQTIQSYVRSAVTQC